jgi:hypothetical protein
MTGRVWDGRAYAWEGWCLNHECAKVLNEQVMDSGCRVWLLMRVDRFMAGLTCPWGGGIRSQLWLIWDLELWRLT